MDKNGTELRMSGVLGRLEEVLERENALIGSDPTFDIKASNAKKSRCLYELNLLVRSLGTNNVPKEYHRRIRDLRKTLEANSIRIKAHLDAVRGVTDLINEAVQASEADGTYSLEQFRAGAAQ
jgi:hypothetical protein